MRVLAVDADAAKVDALCRRYTGAGLLGTRVELFVARPFEFLFPPYLANLVVSEDPAEAGISTKLDGGTLFDVLRPYGGTLCLQLSAEQRAALEARAGAAEGGGVLVKQEGRWTLWVREG